MIKTGQDLIRYFKSCCEKQNKLLIPDSPRQEAVADSLANFYKTDNLELGIDRFVKSKPGPFLIFDFAIESRSYVDKTKFESKSVNAFKEIVEQTKKRMESE